MDLKLKDVAGLLNVSETTIRRWLQEGKIPAYKINAQYRFNRSEIEDWVMKHKLTSDNGASPFNHAYPPSAAYAVDVGGGNRQYSLYRAIHKGNVLYNVKAENKKDLILKAAHLIAPELDLDKDILAELLWDRESLQSTAVGNGIAIPHTRDILLKGQSDTVVIVFPEHPMDFKALDNKPVNILFFLFATDDARHLHLLAKIAYLSSQPDMMAFFKQKPSKEKLLEFIKSWECRVKQPGD